MNGFKEAGRPVANLTLTELQEIADKHLGSRKEDGGVIFTDRQGESTAAPKCDENGWPQEWPPKTKIPY